MKMGLLTMVAAIVAAMVLIQGVVQGINEKY